VRLQGAEIGGTLDCDGGRFKNAKSAALNAERAKISGPVLLRNGFESEGEVRLFGAEIGGIACDGGRFRNTQGTALNAEGAKISGPVYLRKSSESDKSFESEGEVRLFRAEIGALECGGGRFKNVNGKALSAEGAKIGGPVLLRNGFESEGEVRLQGGDWRLARLRRRQVQKRQKRGVECRAREDQRRRFIARRLRVRRRGASARRGDWRLARMRARQQDQKLRR